MLHRGRTNLNGSTAGPEVLVFLWTRIYVTFIFVILFILKPYDEPVDGTETYRNSWVL
jgi:hypothetical protein